MGKRVRIKCNCENRESVGAKIYDNYKGGHDNRAITGPAPNDLFAIRYALNTAYDKDLGIFNIFVIIGNWKIYDNKHLILKDG